MIRKCIYTGKDAKSKDSVIPKQLLGEEIHNWANYAPCDSEDLQSKQDRLPSETEMQANELFKLLELSRLRVKYYEQKLAEIQQQASAIETVINSNMKDGELELVNHTITKRKPTFPEKPTKSEKRRLKEMETAEAQKLVQETMQEVDRVFEKKKSLWE